MRKEDSYSTLYAKLKIQKGIHSHFEMAQINSSAVNARNENKKRDHYIKLNTKNILPYVEIGASFQQ